MSYARINFIIFSNAEPVYLTNIRPFGLIFKDNMEKYILNINKKNLFDLLAWFVLSKRFYKINKKK